MARYYVKNLDTPDDAVELDRVSQHTVRMGDVTGAWTVLKPGWRWSVDVKPLAGGDWCQSRHVGIQLSGHMRIRLDDGTEFDLTPRDVYVVPPGHDGWVIGDEPAVSFAWSGAAGWIPALEFQTERVLTTVLMTDIVESTATAASIGDQKWRLQLSSHNERVREIMSRFRGHEVNTTGDGFLATFDGAARALRCAQEIVRVAAEDNLALRVALHTGEIERVGDDIRGMTVHEVARMLSVAGAGQIVVSSLTRQLAEDARFHYVDLGEQELRGIDGPRRLFAVTIGP